jgi:ABC-2 type transport system permease protein
LNIWNIALKEIKQNIRDRRTFLFMLAFPIVLMLILGTSLSNAFNHKIQVDNIRVLYKSTAGPSITTSFEAFAKKAAKSGIHFKRTTKHMDGKREVKENNYTAYVEISDKGIQLYSSEQNNIEESIVQGMLKAYADKYNVAAAVASIAPENVNIVMKDVQKNNFIQERTLKEAKQQSSMDYYAVAMTTMIALYGAIYASTLIRSERVRNTALRLVAAPIGKGEIFLGKILGYLFVNALCLLVVIIFSHFAFKANWGDRIGIVFILLLSEVFLALSIGLGISYMAKTPDASKMIIMVFLQLSSFFGGAYFKIENAKGILGFITNLSPLTWANQAITKIIYMNDFGSFFQAISLNLGISVLFLGIAIFIFQRREGL